MKGGYGQFCPVAKACEILAQRWTPLVVRELLVGSTRFNDIRRGVPLMSPTLLSKRLRTLEQAGIVRRVVGAGGRSTEYRLTFAGEELRPIVELVGMWGARWVESELDRDELDASLLMWDIRRTLDAALLLGGRERVVILFCFRDAPKGKRRWWLVAECDEVQLCLTDPGRELDMIVDSDVRSLTRVWVGDLEMERALRQGGITAQGDRRLVESFPRWLRESPFAKARREALR